jgi:Holliday junction DNA helicase RuvA
MYDHIQGNLVFKSPTQAVVSAGGVGYRLTIPFSTFDALPGSGAAKLFAHLQVRDDALKLYGFATEAERRLFTQLIGVGGIGPNTAIAVLNGIHPDDFRRAVAAEKADELCRIKGIGRKTAERIIVELKRDMERELIEETGSTAGVRGAVSDAVAAMLALGYTRSSAEKAVTRALEKLGREASSEQVVREALQQV